MSTPSSDLTSRIHEVVLAAFAADSFSLGAHWEYNTDNIHKVFNPQLTTLQAPIASYHKGKVAGDQTHIGDNSIILLQSLADNKTFNREAFLAYWLSKWDVPTPSGYVDHVTKTLIKSTHEGKTGLDAASDDDDLSHSSRFFPLLLLYHTDEDELVKQALTLTTMFQRGKDEQTSSEFLARVTYRVLKHKIKPSQAIDEVDKQMNNSWLSDRIKVGKASTSVSALDAIRSHGGSKDTGVFTMYFGLACPVKYGIPAVVRSLIVHEVDADPAVAIIEDVNLGGNSNARSIAIATILTAYKGISHSKIQEWIQGLTHRQEIEQLISKIESSK